VIQNRGITKLRKALEHQLGNEQDDERRNLLTNRIF